MGTEAGGGGMIIPDRVSPSDPETRRAARALRRDKIGDGGWAPWSFTRLTQHLPPLERHLVKCYSELLR